MDVNDDRCIEEYLGRECGCLKNDGKACSTQFDAAYVRDVRLSFKALSSSELDMFIMGQLIAFSNTSITTNSSNRNVSHERRNNYTSFQHHGKPICRNMFLFLHGISKKKLFNIKSSLSKNGIAPRVHGNTKRLPANTMTLQSVEYVVRFLLSYTEQHGLLLLGRVPGYSRDDIKLLPSSISKRGIWNVYTEAASGDDSVHVVAYSTFCQLWRKLLPSIWLMKPMTDLCWTCQRNSTAILRAANCPDGAKSSVIEEAQEHLRVVQCERSFYKTTCDDCKHDIRDYFTEDGIFQPSPLASQTQETSVHIIRLIMHSRSTILQILCSQAQYTSLLQGSV